MARHRGYQGTNIESTIIDMMSRGGTAEAICAQLNALGFKVSRSTVSRRMCELRDQMNKERSARQKERELQATTEAKKASRAWDIIHVPVAQPAEHVDSEPTESSHDPDRAPSVASFDIPDSIPDDADPKTLDWWISKAEEMGRTAEAEGDLDAFGKMGRVAVTLLEHKRKATPPTRPDPNVNPDMIAAAERARETLHKLVDSAVGDP